jgi:hypothetical protein
LNRHGEATRFVAVEQRHRGKPKIMCGELSYEMELLSGFIDSCLPLTPDEEKVLEAELAKLPPEECEGVMEIVTSWMRKGIQRGKRELLVAQLHERLGSLDKALEDRIDPLSAEQLQDLAR